MRFVDRDRELQTLQQEYARTSSSMVIIYGRRRVGKTELIRHFIEDPNCNNKLNTRRTFIQ